MLIIKKLVKIWAENTNRELRQIITVTILETTPNKENKTLHTQNHCDWHPDYTPDENDTMDYYIFFYRLAVSLRLLVTDCDDSLKNLL